MQALGDDDKASIQQTIDDDVLQRRTSPSARRAVEPGADGAVRVEGELTLAGTTHPVAFDLAAGDGRHPRPARRSSSRDWGIKPYSALFGALKVADEVEVEIDGRHASVAVDRLRVEPALDAGRQRAGAVRVERDVLDRLDLRRVVAVAGRPRRR